MGTAFIKIAGNGECSLVWINRMVHNKPRMLKVFNGIFLNIPLRSQFVNFIIL